MPTIAEILDSLPGRYQSSCEAVKVRLLPNTKNSYLIYDLDSPEQVTVSSLLGVARDEEHAVLLVSVLRQLTTPNIIAKRNSEADCYDINATKILPTPRVEFFPKILDVVALGHMAVGTYAAEAFEHILWTRQEIFESVMERVKIYTSVVK